MGGSKFLVGYKLENIGKPVGFFSGRIRLEWGNTALLDRDELGSK